MKTISFNRPLMAAVAAVIYIICSMFVLVNEVHANGRALNQGYFFNQTLTTGFNVLQGGIPEAAMGTNKEAFINFIESRWAGSTRYGPCPGNGCDYAGSAYIIQTMRGPDGAGNWDQSFPDLTAFNDWKARVRSPNIAMRWGFEGAVYGAGLTTDRFKNGAERDVAKTGGATSGKTLVFYNTSTGAVYYMLRESCANPLGSLPGIPNIPIDYNLIPSVTTDRVTGEPGESVTVTSSVVNTGNATAVGTYWAVSTMSFDPGASVPTAVVIGDNGGVAAVNPAKPCQYYASQGANDCRQEPGNTGTANFIVGTTPMGSANLIIGDYPVGTKACYALSLYSYNEATGTSQRWAHSDVKCVTVSKKPKVQVLGGDLSVGKAFSGTTGALPPATVISSTSNKDIGGTRRTFGSWVEYGIFATGAIGGTASGSAYAGPGMDNPTICKASFLSFTNSGSSVCLISTVIGNYATTRSIPDVAASFAVGSSTPSFGNNPTINLATNPQGVYTASGDVRINAGGIAKGQWLVINAPNSTVTIAGNITYTSDVLRSLGDIPQLVIIAKNINIEGGVTRVDAWLIAKASTTAADGVINTCSTVAVAAPLSSTICNQPLIVNGPVMAQKLHLRRTGGSGPGAASGDAAETFNLRPDAYLWAQAQATVNGLVQTVYTTELPPRL